MKLKMMTVAFCLAGCGEVLPKTQHDPVNGQSSDSRVSPSTVNSARSRLECPASPAAALMNNAVCVCRSLQAVGQGITTHAAPGQSADVGINEANSLAGKFNVEGSLRAHQSLAGVGELTVRDDLITFGSMMGVGVLSVGGDLQVAGNLTDVGQLNVGGTIHVGGTVQQVGSPTPITPSPFTLPDELPCNCGGLDVAATVATAQADPAIQPLAAVQSAGETSLQLTTGSYFLPSFAAAGRAELVIQGAVALYVGGSVNSVGQTVIDVPSGSTLDLYVAGDLMTVGESLFKSSPQPGAVRLYVGGNYISAGQQDLSLSLYAPNANVQWAGDTKIHGSVLVGSLLTAGALDVDYAAPVAADPQFCEDPVGDGSDGGTGTTNTPDAGQADGGAPFVEGIN